MPRIDIRILLAATAFVAALAIMPGPSGLAAAEPGAAKKESAEEGVEKESEGPLSPNEYFTMAPFVVPVIKDGRHHKQFVLVVAIELEDVDDRDELRRLSPRMRNEIYELLFKVVSFRTMEPRVPRKEFLRTKLIRVVQRIAGKEMAKSIRVHGAKIVDIH